MMADMKPLIAGFDTTKVGAEISWTQYTADKRIELGFRPKKIMLSFYFPAYTSSRVYQVNYDEDLWGRTVQKYIGQTATSVVTGAVPYPNPNAAILKSVDDTGFTIGFNPNVGASYYSYIAVG